MERPKSLFARIKDLLIRGIDVFQDNKMPVYSGYATLFIVTAIIPFVILIIAIVNLIPGYSAKDVADIMMVFLPDIDAVRNLVVGLMTDLKDHSGGLLASIAAVTTLWSASKGVMAIQKGLDQLDSEDKPGCNGPDSTGQDKDEKPGCSGQNSTAQDKDEKPGCSGQNSIVIRNNEEKRNIIEMSSKCDRDSEENSVICETNKRVMAIQKDSVQLESEEMEEEVQELKEQGKSYVKTILKRLAFTFMLIILIPLLMVFELLRNSISGAIRSVIKELNTDALKPTLDSIDSFFNISSVLIILIALMVMLMTFAFLPAKRRTLKSQIPGAVLSAVCWMVFTSLFSIFIPLFYHSSYLYGTLATIFLLLMWLRYVVMILFAGAVLNRVLEEERISEPRS